MLWSPAEPAVVVFTLLRTPKPEEPVKSLPVSW